MKKLQNNFTTPEQSKRLLELGVSIDSADCYLTRFGIDEDWEVKLLNNVKYSEIAISNQEYCLPCWSIGRLLEIHLKCCTTLNQNDAHIVISRFGIETVGLMQNMYDMVGECALLGKYDFSKLEE